MVQMKILQCAINVNATEILSSSVITANAFQNCGIVILMMIVVIIQTNQLIYVETEIAAMAGKSVLHDTITDAFLVGYFVMARMIVEIILMKLILNCAQNVTFQEISSVKMIDAFHYDGDAVNQTLIVYR